MAGIYIHIPFCRQKCHYCNFYSVASLRQKDAFLQALFEEIALRKDYLGGEEIQTIYFGGGTPSLLSQEELNKIFESIHKYHPVSENAEITLEANPDDLHPEKLKELSQSEVNRLSIGIQSFRDEDLNYLNRVHTAEHARETIQRALDAGFANMSIDLIYGIPTLSNENWIKNLETFSAFNLPHLSAYALTVEPKTPLELMISKGKMKPVLDDHSMNQLDLLIDFTQKSNYEHYEISNFCRDSMYSKHNTSYWHGKKYLGLGPSSHSYNLESRQWNIARTSKYISSVGAGKPDTEMERLNDEQKYNEYIMLSLRTKWGADIKKIEQLSNTAGAEHFKLHIQKYLNNGFVRVSGDIYTLTPKGKAFADGIAGSLFV